MSDFAGYRRDLAVLDPAGGRANPNNPPPPAAAPNLAQVAPWMAASNGGASSPAAGGAAAGLATTFYNDSSDNLSNASQLSPAFRSTTTGRPSGSNDSPDAPYFGDERRPSIASITTTASSQASKTSGTRGGFRKLQGFFGEEFPGRDSSETSLPQSFPGKIDRSHSYSHGRPHRDRNHSNATEHTRDASPSSSRPLTPVPSSDVVPFLYQDAEVSSCFFPQVLPPYYGAAAWPLFAGGLWAAGWHLPYLASPQLIPGCAVYL
jgi:adenylate cyclase